MFNTLLRQAGPHLIAVLIFLVACVLYFYPQLEGKQIRQGDIISYKGMSKEITDYKEETGKNALWTNSMFGGMPTYQISNNKSGNILSTVDRIFHLFIHRPIGLFFVAMICFYIMMCSLGVNQWVSIIGALAFGLTTNTMTLYEAGHMTKIKTIAYLPLMAAGMVLAYRQRLLLGGALFGLGSGLCIVANHPQMFYYFGMTLVIFVIATLIEAVRNNKIPDFLKATGALAIAGVLAIGANASLLWTTLEYSRDTMRGAPILEKSSEATATTSSEVEGLEWEYAMRWSNGMMDNFASLIPGIVGGGSQEPVSTSSATYQDLKRKGANVGRNFKAPLYWGALPFTSGPIYLGAVIIFFFLLGAIWVKTPIKWWLVLGVVLTFMLAMGKHMAWFNLILFDYFPLFNKFRTPNSALSIASFLAPMLGTLGLMALLEGKLVKEKAVRDIQIVGGVLAAICLYFAFIGTGSFSFAGEGDANLANYGYDVNAVKEDRAALMRSDALRTLFLILAAAGLLWAYLLGRIQKNILLVLLAAITIGDIWIINRRYVNTADFVSKSNYDQSFRPRPADEQILQDKDLSYRVLDLSVNTFNSAQPSYFHKCIGGYHPAKLQRYQDIIDRHITQNNTKVLNMLNMRYQITREGQVARNPEALGNAWFVSNFKTVNSANAEIDALKEVDPKTTAIIHQEYQDYIANFSPQAGGSIQLTAYAPDELTYTYNVPADQFAVFSEVWYGPEKGWQAYIDGEAVPHIRVNYLLRGLKVPAGSHEITFKFEPSAFYTGRNITFICSLLLVLLAVGLIGKQFYQFLQQPPPPAPAPTKTKPKATPKPTTSRTKKTKKDKRKK